MKYERPHSEDWVEIVGASELSVDEFDSLFLDRKAAFAIVQPLIAASSFTRKGKTVDVATAGLGALTWKQWLWLRDRVAEAIKDEMLDPEA